MSTIEEIRARFAAATPGPYLWKGNAATKDFALMARRGWGDVVMDFWRWGMQGARPFFRDRADGVLKPCEYVTSQPYKPWDIVGIDHPDARFIAASWGDVRDLLGEVDRLRAALGSLATHPESGFIFNEDTGEIVCLECEASGTPDAVPPPHRSDCPWALARVCALGKAGIGR